MNYKAIILITATFAANCSDGAMFGELNPGNMGFGYSQQEHAPTALDLRASHTGLHIQAEFSTLPAAARAWLCSTSQTQVVDLQADEAGLSTAASIDGQSGEIWLVCQFEVSDRGEMLYWLEINEDQSGYRMFPVGGAAIETELDVAQVNLP